jgi:hypothetical protein
MPTPVGVPLITPAELSVRPAGKLLPVARVQVYGAVPPVAVNVVVWYTVLTCPPGSATAVIVSTPTLVIVAGADTPEVSLTVILEVPTRLYNVFGTAAVSCAALTNVVTSAVESHMTTDELEKFVPLTVSVNAGLPNTT